MVNILFSNIPIDVTIGLDQYSFNIKKDQLFNGIINIPNGIHIIHFQNNVIDNKQNDSIRYGYWVHDSYNYYLQYDDDDTDIFQLKIEDDLIKYDSIMKEYINRGSVSYFPRIESDDQWTPLVNYIEWGQICNLVILPKDKMDFIYIDSSMITREENAILKDTLTKNRQSGIREEDPHVETCLEYTPIKFKSRNAIRKGYEMIDFTDKSYYFNDVIINGYYKGKVGLYFSELQFSYVNSMLFGNYGSSLQWHYMIEVFCFASNVPDQSVAAMDDVVSQQLKLLPEEYTDMLLNEEMWQRCLNDSFQGTKLLKVKQLIEQKLPHIFPRSKASQAGDKIKHVADNDPEGSEEEYENDENRYLPSIDSDDEDDDGPVVVESLTYR